MYKLENGLGANKNLKDLKDYKELIGTSWSYIDDGLFPPGIVVKFIDEARVNISYRIIDEENFDSYYESNLGKYVIDKNIKIILDKPINTDDFYWEKINSKSCFFLEFKFDHFILTAD